MTTIQDLLDRGARPHGNPVEILSHALMAAARWDDDYTAEQREEMISTLLPLTSTEDKAKAKACYEAVVYNLAISQNAGVIDTVDIPALQRESPGHDQWDLDTIRRPEVWVGQALVQATNIAYYELHGHSADSSDVVGE